MPRIDVTLDAAGVQRGSADLTRQLGAINDRIKEITSTQNVFNTRGVQVGSIIRGLTNDGKEFTATLAPLGMKAKDVANAMTSLSLGLKNIRFTDKKKEIEEVTDKSSKLKEKLDILARSAQYFVTYRAFSFIADGLKEGVAEANKLQIQLSLIRTISQGKEQQSFFQTGANVRAVSDRTGMDVNEIAKGFYDATSNQITKGANTGKFVEVAAQFARATGSEVTDSVNLLSSRINAFGLQASDAGKLAAQFFQTIDEGRVVTAEMANTLGRVDVLANGLGIAMEDVNAVIAITTQKGFKTADAMTLLTNLMIKLEKPTEGTAAFFKELGVNSGEAAVKMLGLPGLMRKIVDAVKTGRVDASAFFDEIRGRKQFAVFEQSIDEIEAFSKKNKDIKNVVQQYEEALTIRGESPADKLNIELNKLKNVFKVDFGQALLKNAADIVTWVGGVDNAKQNAADLGSVLRTVGTAAVGYGVVLAGVTAWNMRAAVSFTALGTAAKLVWPVLLAYGTFRLTQRAMGVGNDTLFGEIDPNRLNMTGEALERMRVEYEKFKKAGQAGKIDPFASFDKQNENITQKYREVLGILANATKANSTFLDETKSKSREAAEAMKIGFQGWGDVLKQKITDFKKVITEARNEIEKSAKSTLKFKESLDQLLFQTQLKYANDEDRFGNQKQKLTEQQIERLTSRATELFKQGTPESVDEARRLFDEIARLEADNKDRRVESEKARLERELAQNPLLAAQPGANILSVSTEDLQKRLNALLALRNQLEEEYVKKQEKTVKNYEVGVKAQTETNRKFEQAVKTYEQIEVFNKDGSIRSEFRDKTSGRFDPKKFEDTFRKAEDEIRKFAPTSYAERLEFEQKLADRRKALMREANAQQRADDLETYKARLLAEEEAAKKGVDDLKKKRQTLLENQANLLEAFNQKPGELAGFANQVAAVGPAKADLERMKKAMEDYRYFAEKMFDKKIVKDGVEIVDPAAARDAASAYKYALQVIMEVRDKQKNIFGDNKVGGLSLKDGAGREITPGGSLAVIEQQLRELESNSFGLLGNLGAERSTKDTFESQVNGPLQRLKTLFPELATSGQSFTTGLNQQFKVLSTEGVQQLIDKLKEVQLNMQAIPRPGPNKIGMLDMGGMDDSGLAYAATGGHVGFFPGQPRGRDVYPIWAARGEFIVNAESTALYKPMLEAINNRRAPQYMATGGYVGGDTNVGDINITMNAGNSNADTVRDLGIRLERHLRRGTIRLNRK